jgi:rRNA maturation endonuclease Nob1
MRNTVRVRPLAEPVTPVYNRVVCRDCGHCFTQNDSEDCPDCGLSTK